jgi:hypothetical protein
MQQRWLRLCVCAAVGAASVLGGVQSAPATPQTVRSGQIRSCFDRQGSEQAPIATMQPGGSGQTSLAMKAQDRVYHPVILDARGRADPPSLEELLAAVRPDACAPGTQIAVMVHGFRQSHGNATKDYRNIARRLRRAADAFRLKVVPVGVHWPSDPGAMRSYIPRALGHRIASVLGFPKALKNPYLEKARIARETGRTGLRAVLFRLQDEFPGVPLHIFSHSLGAQAIVSALAPEGEVDRGLSREIEQPGRVLRVGMVVLAGADLDAEHFARERAPGARRALDRAEVWWVTVPAPGRADGMLEMRRAAGRGDAIGNTGIQLVRDDFERLRERGALVLEVGNIPTWHRFPRYYNDRRLKAPAASLFVMRERATQATDAEISEAVTAVLRADPEALAVCVRVHNASIGLSASAGLGADAGPLAHIKIVDPKAARPAAPRRPAELRAGSVQIWTADPRPHVPSRVNGK